MPQPTQRTIRVGADTPIAGHSLICRAKRLLSPINHRLYREGRTYVQKVDLDADSTQVVEVYALADTWMVHKAWKMAYDHYMANTAEERATAGTNAARWADFSIHAAVTNFAEGLPVQFGQIVTTLDPAVYTAGEFTLSDVSLDNGNTRYFSWTTASSGTVFNVLEEYDLAGNVQQSPEDAVSTAPYADLNADEINSTIYQHVQNDGNEPPYNPDSLGATTPFVHVATLSAGTAQKLSTGFFRAPCGLILLKGYAPADSNTQDVSITYKSGSYKGVDAPSMLE
jgi:hypothetical protein